MYSFEELCAHLQDENECCNYDPQLSLVDSQDHSYDNKRPVGSNSHGIISDSDGLVHSQLFTLKQNVSLLRKRFLVAKHGESSTRPFKEPIPCIPDNDRRKGRPNPSLDSVGEELRELRDQLQRLLSKLH